MDSAQARKILGRIPYGLYLLGSRDHDRRVGMVATWVSQVSFSPQLIAVALENQSHMRQCIEAAGYFSLNLLPPGAKKYAAKFLKQSEVEEGKGQLKEYSDAASGSPFFSAAAACLECRVVQRLVTGDHEIVIGEVVDAVNRLEGEVLTQRETGWKYER